MSPHAVSYGAVELKQVAQRYWITGFLISLLLHSIILGLFHLPWFKSGIDLANIPLHPPELVFAVPVNPVIPGTVPPPPGAHAAASPNSRAAVPVPVPDGSVSPEQTIESQEDARIRVDPGTQLGNGEGDPPVINLPPPPDDQPIPFEVVEKPPMVVSAVAPVYPELAARAGIEGKVLVKVLVGKDGLVREVSVLKSNADILNEASLTAARQFRFTPGIMNNGPVSVWMVIPFTFKLR